jgi:hypothetical protein
MAETMTARDQSICSMYRNGVSLRTLQAAFGMGELEIIQVLRANGVVEPEPGESEARFLDRIRDDVKHAG